MTDVTDNMGASNVLQVQLAAYFQPHITQFKSVSVCADKEHYVSCSNLFVYL